MKPLRNAIVLAALAAALALAGCGAPTGAPAEGRSGSGKTADAGSAGYRPRTGAGARPGLA